MGWTDDRRKSVRKIMFTFNSNLLLFVIDDHKSDLKYSLVNKIIVYLSPVFSDL